jgi:two-component system, response regulator PdtaR
MPQTTILIAEDETAIRARIATYLTDAGFEVLEANDAAAAVALIDSRKVDLVFSDVNMPGAMKGDALAKWLSTRHPGLPVILTSGVERPNLSGNVRRFIPKPYLMRDVEKKIRELLH